ncbi:PREDICTED: gasdermin-A3-like [Odobenus rosmarus divergens]|uniref:Gasdermin-A3-like n=1 Tax=Odobenus rosmarus divergens TaxID=9708 RepID=A0A9B0H2G8_ODORO
MSSLFARDARSVVRELGRRGELVPADNLNSAPHLSPFCLVRKKHRRHPWPWDTPFIPTDFSLMDALEPSSPIPELNRSQSIQTREMVAGAVTGAMSVSTGLPVQVTGNSGVIHSSTLTLQGQSHMAEEKAVTIPRGTVLAYRVLQLGMREDCWAVLYLPERKLGRDFSGALAYSWALGEEPNFQGLQRQVGVQLQDLATLPAELRHPLLSALQELLQDPQALQELEDTMEQALDTGVLGQLVGPGGFILSTIRNPSGSLLTSKGRAILCILGAPVVLRDTQHCLLTQSMERGIMPQQLELVASILQPNFNQMEETTFSLPLEVLSSLQSEDAALSLSLVESCGLELQGTSQQLMWDPDLVPQLSALYGSLTGLQMLAAPSPVAL